MLFYSEKLSRYLGKPTPWNRPLYHCQSLPSVLSNAAPLPPSLPSFSPSILQVAHSLQPLPPPCSLRPFRPLRPPHTTPPPARLHRSGNARCPCWRKTPPILTWSPTRMTHTCSGLSPPPRVRESSPFIHLPFYPFILFIYISICHPSPGSLH